MLYLNEPSVMHSLRQRYGGNLIHTYAGPNMVVINPLSTPSMYSEKVSLILDDWSKLLMLLLQHTILMTLVWNS